MIIYNTDYKRENMIYPELEKWQFYPFNEYDIKDMCFFDIETTGLSPETFVRTRSRNHERITGFLTETSPIRVYRPGHDAHGTDCRP